eukprot:1161828-Pelagomonas_calceolata.AAC.12
MQLAQIWTGQAPHHFLPVKHSRIHPPTRISSTPCHWRRRGPKALIYVPATGLVSRRRFQRCEQLQGVWLSHSAPRSVLTVGLPDTNCSGRTLLTCVSASKMACVRCAVQAKHSSPVCQHLRWPARHALSRSQQCCCSDGVMPALRNRDCVRVRVCVCVCVCARARVCVRTLF